MNFQKIYQKLQAENIGDILIDEPLYKHTSFKVGGPARLYIYPFDLRGLKKLLAYIKKHKLKYKVIGNGSDLLFSDREYEGIIICLIKYFKDVQINGCIVKAQAGVMMITLANQCAKYGLSGFEFMSGIPGSIGGGIFMNAGAYKYDLASVTKQVTVLKEDGSIVELSKEEMEFGYRSSIVQKNPEWTIIDATFELSSKDPEEIKAVIAQRKERRMASQPWNLPSAGSVFRNPELKGAWQYIDEAKLRGYEIGGAQVSPKHSNFIVNNGYASAKDIYDLIKLVQKEVYEHAGIKLIPEIELVNWE